MSDLPQFNFDVVTVDTTGQEKERDRGQAFYRVETLDENTTLELVRIPAGNFLMGADRSELGWRTNQSPQHLVTLAAFWLSKYPITQGQWQAIAQLPKINVPLNPQPSCFENRDRPVEQITWYEAVEFCDRLSHHCDRPYRLPSEAEWEYAARAQTTTPFHFGPTLTTNLANYSGVSWEYDGKICSVGHYGDGPEGEDRRETTSVGFFQVANAFGLYDMHGLVREWCADVWHDNYQEAPTDGSAWMTATTTEKRVLRGGSWNTGPKLCRSAFRSRFDPNASLYDIGFRVACFEG
ncbi:MAG: formylglycine-generating enzyme family protein [Spirulinaceae cyanobacterium]